MIYGQCFVLALHVPSCSARSLSTSEPPDSSSIFRKFHPGQVTLNPSTTPHRVTLSSLHNPPQGGGPTPVLEDSKRRTAQGGENLRINIPQLPISILLSKISVPFHFSFPKATFNLISPMTLSVGIVLVIEVPVQRMVWPLVYGCHI